jgi:cytoplasmic iron level regulating protein YaaA (DUF328/UPF0246 family)
MITILSPSKTLDFENESPVDQWSEPRLAESTNKLISQLQKKSRKQIGELMNLSSQLADLNYQRFQQWDSNPCKQAVYAFKGDVFQGMEPEKLDKCEMEFAQEHLRILSGLYGVLRPLDRIQPYRLEMGTKLKVNKSKNLYEYWNDQPTVLLNEDFNGSDHKVLVNLASKEYSKVIDSKKLNAEIITPEFKDFKNGKFKVIPFYAKKARGAMAAFIARNRIDNPEYLKTFEWEGYSLNYHLTKDNNLVFSRGEQL